MAGLGWVATIAWTVVCGWEFWTVRLWIFFICTLRWSVLLKTWPHVLHGCGTNRPWCWCLTWRNRVHFKLNIRAHMAHWNFGPSGVWHIVYTESVLVSLFSLFVGDACPGGGVQGVGPRSSLRCSNSPAVIGQPTNPPSETREGVTVRQE